MCRGDNRLVALNNLGSSTNVDAVDKRSLSMDEVELLDSKGTTGHN